MSTEIQAAAPTPPSEAAVLCVTVLAVVHAWLVNEAADARIRAEVEPGRWETIRLVDACEKAMAEFRAEHGGTV